MDKEKIAELVSHMTLEEKVSLTSGHDNWYTESIERLGIHPVRMSDGPHGLRTQSGDINTLDGNDTVMAVCFPAACAAGASFDEDLMEELGKELGREAQALGVNVLLGPGINIKRSPLCGRNFEYFSEDPLVSGRLGAAYVKGLQSEGVGASLKHFFANNQETRRMDTSSEVDERTMYEIYLPAFECIVKEAQPWTVMASYNKIGGIYSTENKRYITDLLRKTWGYQGVVISDWGAVHDRVSAIASSIPGGLNLKAIEMLAGKMGSTAGGTSGLKKLLEQPLATLQNFLPSPQKEQLDVALAELNKHNID